MAQTVKEFVSDAYQIVSASSPNVPLQGNDTTKGIQFLNELLSSFSGTGAMLTVPRLITTNVVAGQAITSYAAAGADVNQGRLANCADAWIVLTGVTYPLIPISQNSFFQSYKYAPLRGLPRFAIILPGVDITYLQIYPAPSQQYELNVYGKFELPLFTQNSTMALLPLYYSRWLKMALAKDLARYKGRLRAWTPDLQSEYLVAKDDMLSCSSMNLNIVDPIENQLNGAYRVRSGI